MMKFSTKYQLFQLLDTSIFNLVNINLQDVNEIQALDDLHRYMTAKVKQNGMLLFLLKEELLIPELCLLAVEYEASYLLRIPTRYWTEKMMIMYVSQSGDNLKKIPKDLQTVNVVYHAVIRGGRIQHANPKLLTEEIILIALVKNPSDIYYIDTDVDTDVLSNIWLTIVCNIDLDLSIVPERYKTHNFYCKLIRRKPSLFNIIPEVYRTKELYIELVNTDGMQIVNVPQEYVDEEMYMIAILNNWEVIKYISDEYKTANVCHLSYTFSYNAILYMPIDFISIGMLLKALTYDPSLIRVVPEEYNQSLDEHHELITRYIATKSNVLSVLDFDTRTNDHDKRCVICWDETKLVTNCKHRLCIRCLLYYRSNVCPICRQLIRE